MLFQCLIFSCWISCNCYIMILNLCFWFWYFLQDFGQFWLQNSRFYCGHPSCNSIIIIWLSKKVPSFFLCGRLKKYCSFLLLPKKASNFTWGYSKFNWVSHYVFLKFALFRSCLLVFILFFTMVYWSNKSQLIKSFA